MSEHKHCQSVLDNLSVYLDGEASEALCAEIERHLAACTDCRVVVDTLNKTIALYHMLPKTGLPDSLRKRLYKTLDLEQFLPRDEP
jgi:predicted anti-sigma-YlaC factor YlaD